MEKRKVIYYTDEQNDEFSTFTATPPRIDGSYDYERKSPFKRFLRFFLYRVVMYPAGVIYARLAFRQKIVGREKLKPYRGCGVFLFGNHTQPTGDAFMQTRVVFPRMSYVVVHPNNLAVPVIGKMVPSLGGLPLPDDMEAYRNFRAAINAKIAEGHPVVVYPEAHIWPYNTGIRDFPDTSFAYPVETGAPSFCFVNTYHKRRFGGRARIVTYVEGPFFAPEEGTPRARRRALRDEVHGAMTQLAILSDHEVVKYIKKETDGENADG